MSPTEGEAWYDAEIAPALADLAHAAATMKNMV